MSLALSSPEQQFAAVLHAPLPFLLVCAVAIALIWFMLNWRFDAKIDRLSEERDRYKTLYDSHRSEASPPNPKAPAPVGRHPVTPYTKSSFSSEEVSERDTGLKLQASGLYEIAISLMNKVEGKTAIKSADIARGYIGNNIRVGGIVFEVTDVLEMVTVMLTLPGHRHKLIYLIFEDDLDRIRRLDKGQNVTVDGFLKAVSGNEIQLERCVLIE